MDGYVRTIHRPLDLAALRRNREREPMMKLRGRAGAIEGYSGERMGREMRSEMAEMHTLHSIAGQERRRLQRAGLRIPVRLP
jgi:hypothetical protein